MSTPVLVAAQEQLNEWYPQFNPILSPSGTGAARAWRGTLQPFPDGTQFANVVFHMAHDQNVRIEQGGRLVHPYGCGAQHSCPLAFSPIIASAFDIILLDWDDNRHPRVYAVQPEISRRRYSSHPHLRDDQLFFIEGRPLPALCVYLASENERQPDDDEYLVKVLDATSLYLAKHVVYNATNIIETAYPRTGTVIITRNAGVLRSTSRAGNYDGIQPLTASYYRNDVVPDDPNALTRERWWWPGPEAPHYLNELVAQISPDRECPCGGGQLYRNCHLNEHRRLLGLPPLDSSF